VREADGRRLTGRICGFPHMSARCRRASSSVLASAGTWSATDELTYVSADERHDCPFLATNTSSVVGRTLNGIINYFSPRVTHLDEARNCYLYCDSIRIAWPFRRLTRVECHLVSDGLCRNSPTFPPPPTVFDLVHVLLNSYGSVKPVKSACGQFRLMP